MKKLIAFLFIAMLICPIFANDEIDISEEPSKISIPERFHGLWRNSSEILEVTEDDIYFNGMPFLEELNDVVGHGVVYSSRDSNDAFTMLYKMPNIKQSFSFVFALEENKYLLLGASTSDGEYVFSRYWKL